MKPWFEKESNVIQFPKPKAKVVQMPNVASYPDFLTGVKDLHNRKAKGEISQDSHDKLYQDLIHRFMKKESFDTPWFLREAEPQDIQALAKRVGNLPADVSDRIISKIQSALVLARKQATAKDKDPKGKSGEMNRFKRTSGALSKVKDPDMQAEYGDVARAMLGNDLTDKEIAQIIRSIAQNKCINMSALKSSASDLSKIIPTYNLSTETQNYYKSVFRMTKYGVGAGEILFSTHSKDLYKGGKGDLTVVGTEQEIELKGGQSKPGRFVDQDTKPSPQYFSKAQAFVKKYNKIIKGPASGFKFTDIHSAIIDNSNANVKSKLLSDFRSVVAELFPNDAKAVSSITTAMAKPSLDITKLTQFYGAALVRRYFEAKKGGMGILFLRFKTDPPSTNYAESLEALQKFATIQPNSQGYVISTEARNVFPQTDVIITQ